MASVPELAVTFDGQPVPTPPGADPVQWAAFARSVVPVRGGCHLWMGKIDGAGYGSHKVRAAPQALFGDTRAPQVTGAHRYAWAVFNGPISTHQHVLHRCDEPLCAPVTAQAAADHLFLGDAQTNAVDRESKGRGGRRRHGVRRRGADTRERHTRSVALQTGVRTALDCGLGVAGLLAVVEEINREGDPHRDQLALLPMPSGRLHVVR